MELYTHYWSQTDSDSPNNTPNTSKDIPKLVLLHGMGGTGGLWRPLAAGLENEMAILAPDQRGHGKSRTAQELKNFHPKDFGQDVMDTMEARKFHPAWILGHSMGVRTAVAAAYLKPEWVRGLVLVDIGFSGPAGGGLGDGLAQFLKKLPSQFPSREDAKKFMLEFCPDPSIAQYLMAVATREASGQISFPFDHSALIQTIESVREFSLRNWLQTLAEKGMPIYALRGVNSLVWSSEDYLKEKAYFSQYSNMHFMEVPNAGHGLPFEQRNVVIDLLKRTILTP